MRLALLVLLASSLHGEVIHSWDCFVVDSLKMKTANTYEVVGHNKCSTTIPSMGLSVKFLNAAGERIGVDYAFSSFAISPGEKMRRSVELFDQQVIGKARTVLIHLIKDDPLEAAR